jgi:hypothetical protein
MLLFKNTVIAFPNEILLWLDLKFTKCKELAFCFVSFQSWCMLSATTKGKYIVHCTTGLKIAEIAVINATKTLRINHKESSVTYVRRL